MPSSPVPIENMWRSLCFKLATETDPDRLSAYFKMLDDMLESYVTRLAAAKNASRPEALGLSMYVREYIDYTRLGPLEREMLEEVWSRGNVTVRELVEAGNKRLAYTTIMTTLDRLFKKGLLQRTAEGKAFRYSPSLKDTPRGTKRRMF